MVSRPSSSLRSLQSEVNHLFDSLFPTRDGSGESVGQSATWSPRMDIGETEKNYRLRVDLPGVARDDVTINVDGRRLVIRGERTEEKQEEGENMVRTERNHGSFYRAMSLPTEVNPDEATARMEAGVLIVELPKVATSTATSISIS